MFTEHELEILKTTLECDIMHQKKSLQQIEENGGSDIRFEMWLEDSKQLFRKVTLMLSDMKTK